MNSTAPSNALLSHDERIAAIRERAQRHVQHATRLFAPPPAEEDHNLLPMPSLLAVACTAALANQAQAQTMDERDLSSAISSRGVNYSIQLGADIKLSKDLDTFRSLQDNMDVYKSLNIDGQGNIIDGNENRMIRGSYSFNGSVSALRNLHNIEIHNGVNK